MTDFKIRRGLSEQIFEDKLTLKPHSRLLLEEGTWYLCTDTAELFLGLLNTATGKIELKQINGSHDRKSADRFYINANGELCVVFSDGTEEAVGKVTGEENNTVIKIGSATFSPENGVIELPDFATKDDIIDAINEIELPDVNGFITIEDVEAKGYLTEHQDLSEYAKKSELPTVDGLASEEFVIKKIAEAELADQDVDLSAYYTKSEVDALIPEVPTKVSELENDASYITAADVPETDLSNYYNKTETENVIAEAVDAIEHPTVDLSGYTTKDYVAATTCQNKYEVLPIEGMLIQYRDGEIRLNTQRVVPTKQEVGATGNPNMYYATFKAFAPDGATQCKEGLNGTIDTEFSTLATDAHGRKYTTIWAAIANTSDGTTWTKWGDSSTLDKYLGFYYHFHWYNGDELISTEKVRLILTNDTCHDDLVPDAVARRIDDKIKAIDVPKTDMTGYATEEFVTNEIAKISIPDVSDFITMSDVEAKNYLTEHQDISHLAEKEHMHANYAEKEHEHDQYLTEHQSLEGLATEDFVRTEIASIDIPETDLSEYSTTSEMNTAITAAITNKADDVPFTTTRVVVNSIGNLKEGEDISGLTIAEIFAKLLGLTNTPGGSEIPSDTPIKDSIIKNNLPLYQANDDGTISKVAYNHLTFDSETVQEELNTISGFYEAIDETSQEVTEYGYQHITEPQDMFYMVALPNTLTFGENGNTSLMTWDDMTDSWVETDTFNLTNDYDEVLSVLSDNGIDSVPEVPEGYTLWADLNEINPGRKYRFIIKEGE